MFEKTKKIIIVVIIIIILDLIKHEVRVYWTA